MKEKDTVIDVHGCPLLDSIGSIMKLYTTIDVCVLKIQ